MTRLVFHTSPLPSETERAELAAAGYTHTTGPVFGLCGFIYQRAGRPSIERTECRMPWRVLVPGKRARAFRTLSAALRAAGVAL